MFADHLPHRGAPFQSPWPDNLLQTRSHGIWNLTGSQLCNLSSYTGSLWSQVKAVVKEADGFSLPQESLSELTVAARAVPNGQHGGVDKAATLLEKKCQQT